MFLCGTSLHNYMVFSIWAPLAKYRGCDPSWGFEVEAEKSEEGQEFESDAYELA